MPEEFESVFRDDGNRTWAIQLTNQIVFEFCQKYKIKMEKFLPELMDAAQLLELAYAGTRYTSIATAQPETLIEFLERLNGPGWFDAQKAAETAIINFFLNRLPPEKRNASAEIIKKQNPGLGEMSEDSGE